MRILIVENEVNAALAVREGLIRAGHTAAIAMGKRESEFLAARDTFDLALVDVDVWNADEISVAGLVRSTRHIPSVFVCDQATRGCATSQLAIGLISRPFELADLIEAIAFLECTLCNDARNTRCPSCLELLHCSDLAAAEKH